jgi:hypothetical protein
MKNLFTTALLLAILLPYYAGAETPVGTPGVENGDCFSDSSGHSSEVAVKGMMTGNQKVTVTETTTTSNPDGTTTTTTETGSTEEGTPDPEGGCADSGQMKVGDSWYRVKNGKLQRENDNEDWINQSEGTCGNNNVSTGDEIGSLPKHAPDTGTDD